VDHEYVQTYWQPRPQLSVANHVADLTSLRPWIKHLHVFHWLSAADGSRIERNLLSEGQSAWNAYLDVLSGTDNEHWLYLEFSKDDDPAATLKDAATLNALLETH